MHEAPHKPKELQESLEKIEKGEELTSDKPIKAYRETITTAEDEQARLTRTPDEEEQLRAVQERLGMTERHNEASDVILENKREQSALEHAQALRDGATELAESILNFGNELGRRDKNGMDPFLDARAFATFKGGYQGLRACGEKQASEISVDELATAVSAIVHGLKQFGGTQRSGVVREDGESLGRIAHSVRSLEEAGAKLSKRFIEGDEDASRALRELRIISDRIYDFALKKREVLRNR